MLAILVAAEPTDNELAVYRTARREFLAGNGAAAVKLLEPLAGSPRDIGPVARFALGTALVEQATRKGVGTEAADHMLRQAIALFRDVLDTPDAPFVDPADVRHNLELAKRQLRWGDRSEKPGDDPRQSPTQLQSETAKSDQPAAELAKPAGELPKSAEQRSESKGEVARPLPGMPFHDPGPIAASAARKTLAETARRIAHHRQERRKLRPAERPRLPEDY